MTVIKDCTGSYLRYDQKEYLICNVETVEGIQSNTKVEVSYTLLDSCSALNDIESCYMLHKYESIIKITKIKVR